MNDSSPAGSINTSPDAEGSSCVNGLVRLEGGYVVVEQLPSLVYCEITVKARYRLYAVGDSLSRFQYAKNPASPRGQLTRLHRRY